MTPWHLRTFVLADGEGNTGDGSYLMQTSANRSLPKHKTRRWTSQVQRDASSSSLRQRLQQGTDDDSIAATPTGCSAFRGVDGFFTPSSTTLLFVVYGVRGLIAPPPGPIQADLGVTILSAGYGGDRPM